MYLAFFTCVSFVDHIIIYFINNYEIPALQNNTIHSRRLREFAPLHPNVVITRVQRVPVNVNNNINININNINNNNVNNNSNNINNANNNVNNNQNQQNQQNQLNQQNPNVTN